jgi:hypothetical protein
MSPSSLSMRPTLGWITAGVLCYAFLLLLLLLDFLLSCARAAHEIGLGVQYDRAQVQGNPLGVSGSCAISRRHLLP